MAHASNWKLRHRIYGLTLITTTSFREVQSLTSKGFTFNKTKPLVIDLFQCTFIGEVFQKKWLLIQVFCVQPVATCKRVSKTHVTCFKMVFKKTIANGWRIIMKWIYSANASFFIMLHRIYLRNKG